MSAFRPETRRLWPGTAARGLEQGKDPLAAMPGKQAGPTRRPARRLPNGAPPEGIRASLRKAYAAPLAEPLPADLAALLARLE